MNNIDLKRQEMDELLNLAQEVSDKLENLKQQNRSSKYKQQYVFLFCGILLFSYYVILVNTNSAFAKVDYSFLVTVKIFPVAIFGAGAFYLVGSFLIIGETKLKIERESTVLLNLLDMVYDFKAINYENFSPSSQAIFDMRLSRISFDVGNYKRPKETPEPPTKKTKSMLGKAAM